MNSMMPKRSHRLERLQAEAACPPIIQPVHAPPERYYVAKGVGRGDQRVLLWRTSVEDSFRERRTNGRDSITARY